MPSAEANGSHPDQGVHKPFVYHDGNADNNVTPGLAAATVWSHFAFNNRRLTISIDTRTKRAARVTVSGEVRFQANRRRFEHHSEDQTGD